MVIANGCQGFLNIAHNDRAWRSSPRMNFKLLGIVRAIAAKPHVKCSTHCAAERRSNKLLLTIKKQKDVKNY